MSEITEDSFRCVLQGVAEPGDLADPLLDDLGAVADHVPGGLDLGRRDEAARQQPALQQVRQPLRVGAIFSELAICHLQCRLSDLLLGGGHGASFAAGGAVAVVTVRAAASGKAGMPRLTAAARRAVIWSIWASLCRAPARLTFRPSASPSQWLASASAMRAVRLLQICTRRGRWAGSGRSSRQRRPGVLVDAGGVVGAAAVAQGDLAPLEVAEELVPFLVGGDPVFGSGQQGPAAGDERPVAADDFLGVDGLVAHGDVDVPVPGGQLRDVRRHPVHDRVGDEQPAEIVKGVAQRGAAGGGDADGGQRVVEVAAQRRFGDGLMLQLAAVLKQQRHRRVIDALVLVIAHDQGDGAVGAADAGHDQG